MNALHPAATRSINIAKSTTQCLLQVEGLQQEQTANICCHVVCFQISLAEPSFPFGLSQVTRAKGWGKDHRLTLRAAASFWRVLTVAHLHAGEAEVGVVPFQDTH